MLHNSMRIPVLTMVVLIIGHVQLHADDNLVANGSFEVGSFVGPTFDHVAPGGTMITSWNVGSAGGDGVDWLSEPSFNAADGSKSIDLVHTTNSSVSQDIATVVGNEYVLSFNAAAVTGFENTGSVTVASLVGEAFAASFSPDFASQAFDTLTYNFTANAAVSTLTFQATGTGGTAAGPTIDNVSVVLIPEPTSLAHIAIVAIAFIGARRRRSANLRPLPS